MYLPVETPKYQIPPELDDVLRAWAKWAKGNVAPRYRSTSLETKFRHARCPDCYELDDPCEVCKASVSKATTKRIVGVEMETVEKAITRLGQPYQAMVVHTYLRNRPLRACERSLKMPFGCGAAMLFESCQKLRSNLAQLGCFI